MAGRRARGRPSRERSVRAPRDEPVLVHCDPAKADAFRLRQRAHAEEGGLLGEDGVPSAAEGADGEIHGVLRAGADDQALPIDHSEFVVIGKPLRVDTALPLDAGVPAEGQHLAEVGATAGSLKRGRKPAGGGLQVRHVHREIDGAGFLDRGWRRCAAGGDKRASTDVTGDQALPLGLGVRAGDRADPDVEGAGELAVGGSRCPGRSTPAAISERIASTTRAWSVSPVLAMDGSQVGLSGDWVDCNILSRSTCHY